MSYQQYKNSGQSGCKLLYQLHKLGVPLYIVESLIFHNGKITYCKKPFATYVWCITDTPIFTFEAEYEVYNKSLKQPKLMRLKDLLAERENMMAGLLFYANEHSSPQGVCVISSISAEKGNVANYCLGREIPDSEIAVVKSVLENVKWSL